MSNEEVVFSLKNSEASTTQEIFKNDTNSDVSFRITLRTKVPSQNETSSHFSTRFAGEKSSSNELDETYRYGAIFSVLWKSGKLGAAYYNPSDFELYIVQDILDVSPEFSLMKNLYHQVTPSLTITVGNITSQFVHALANVSRNSEDASESSITTDTVKSLPPNIELLKTKEYSFDVCENAVRNLRLPNEPLEASETDRLIYLRSIINFDRHVSVYALGALLLFLNKYKSTILQEQSNNEHLYLNVNTVSIQDLLLMDNDTFQALQIFNPIGHPAAFKRGQLADNKEGLSLYKLFNRCMSSLGKTTLRALLLHPTNNIATLSKRLEFIDFCLKPLNTGFVKGMEDCLKLIYPISNSLSKIHGQISTVNNWKILCSTLHNILILQRMIKQDLKNVEVFYEFDKSIHYSVELILNTINDTIDFESSSSFKICVKSGVDEELDKKKQYRAELRDKITLAAQYEIRNFPSYIKDCSIVYIPHIGYLVAVDKWDQNASHADLQQYGFRHMFAVGDTFHFKSPVCDELDECLGDIHTDIKNHESRLILRLSQHVMAKSNHLKAPLKFIGLFDSLISMAKVAKEFGYVRPELILENVINIEEGRHPLLDVCVSNFVPNNFMSGGGNCVVKIITGPNNSGKSIYLKQNALIVYMAHIGSYVPAKFARIGIMHGIHSCLQTIESANIRLSAFAIELRQISEASRCSKKNSLIIIDEFGKATTEYDGLVLLTAYLEQFLLAEEHCPHILVSTHYLKLTQLLPENNFLEHLKCLYKSEEDKITFLHKIVKGISSSFAIHAAACAGIPQDIINRSKELLIEYNENNNEEEKS